MHSRSQHLSALNRLARTGAIIVVSTGIMVLGGWFLNIPLLESFVPGLSAMKVNSAIAFIITGIALWLLIPTEPSLPSLRLARVLSALVVLIGSSALIQDIFKIDLGVDQLLIADKMSDPASYPGRMSPISAFNFVLIGLALFTLKPSRFISPTLANKLAALSLFPTTLAIMGYTYGVSSLYKIGAFTSVSLPTALSFFVLAFSLLAANPLHGIGRLIVSDTAGGVVSRRLLPTVPLALFAFSIVRLEGQKAGLYDTAFGLALMVSVSIAIAVYAIISTAVILRNVDAKQKATQESEEKLHILARRLSLAMHAGQIGVWEWNLNSGQVDWDLRMYEIYGIPEGTVLSYDLWKNSVHREDIAQVEAVLTNTVQTRSSSEIKFRILHPTRGVRFLETREEIVLDTNRKPIACIGVTHDVTERQQLEDALRERQSEIEKLSLTDSLTGVGNRRRLDQAMESEVRRIRRYGGTISVVMADLDHFKKINDTFGHSVGDSVLKAFAGIMHAHIRDTDLVARAGGEEFVILMPECGMDEASEVAERIRVELQNTAFSSVGTVTASFGATELTIGETAEALLRRTDQAMYRAKSTGRNRVVDAYTGLDALTATRR